MWKSILQEKQKILIVKKSFFKAQIFLKENCLKNKSIERKGSLRSMGIVEIMERDITVGDIPQIISTSTSLLLCEMNFWIILVTEIYGRKFTGKKINIFKYVYKRVLNFYLFKNVKIQHKGWYQLQLCKGVSKVRTIN